MKFYELMKNAAEEVGMSLSENNIINLLNI